MGNSISISNSVLTSAGINVSNSNSNSISFSLGNGMNIFCRGPPILTLSGKFLILRCLCHDTVLHSYAIWPKVFESCELLPM